MRILFLSEWRPDGMGNQCMLTSTILAGFIDAFGSMNVVDPWKTSQYRAVEFAMQEWPVFLASTAYMGKPERHSVAITDGYDACVCNLRFLTEAVNTGFIHVDQHVEILRCLDPNKTIVYDGSDDPSSRDDYTEFFGGHNPRLLIRRPSNILGGFVPTMTCHISVPLQHIWRLQAKCGQHNGAGPIMVYAAWNDNGANRREFMERLACSNITSKLLRWGSATGYKIGGTEGTIRQPVYYSEIQRSFATISCAGGNRDCLRTSEALALGSLLITDDTGWDSLKDGTNCLMFSSAEEMIDKIWWALDHREKATEIARNGHRLYLEHESPGHQAVRMVRKSGLI